MKKLFSYILIFAFLIASATGATFSLRTSALADGDEPSSGASTEIFLPTTYLQYYKLENPYAICREEIDGKEFVAISNKGSIVVYTDGKFSKIDLGSLAAEEGVPSLQLYKENFLLFSAGSKLRVLNTSSGEVTETNVVSNNLSVCGDTLAVATNTFIGFYKLSVANGELVIDADEDKNRIDVNESGAMLLSKSGRVYFFKDGKIQYSDVTANDGVKHDFLEETDVKSIAESGDMSDETLYYSCRSGIFAVDARGDKKEIKRNEDKAEEADLGKLWDPQGICVTGKGIWVVDKYINAVQELNLTPDESGDYNFTDFAITTNSRAINRLSANAKDVTYANGSVYALDYDRIVVIENADGDKDNRTYRLMDLPAGVEKFAVGGGYLAYLRTAKTITYGKIVSQKPTDENYDENKYVLEDEKTFELKVEGSDKILDICYGDKAFYVLTTILSGGKNHPYVVKIDCASGNETAFCDMTAEGVSQKIAVDPFDKIYVYAVNGGENVVYSFEGVDKATNVYSSEESLSSGNVVKMQTDFDGRLYFLSDDGRVTALDGEVNNGVTRYDKTLDVAIEKSENLAGVGNPVSFCACAESKKAYFIFGGLILRLDENGENALDITTVNTVPVPDGFSFAYSALTTYGKTIAKAKLFKIDPTVLGNTYFAFIKDGYLSETENADYAFVKINEKYSLAINASVAAIVRNSDVAEANVFETEDLTRYAIVGFETYSLPVLSAVYKTPVKIESGEKIKISGKLSFNGKTYYLIEKNGEAGYIDSSFTTETIAVTPDKSVNKSAYVYDKRGVTVYDENYVSTGKTVKGKNQVRVISAADGYSKVEFTDGTVGYVRNETITYDSKSDFVKCLVAILCSLSFLVLALFFERKYLFTKD